nr:hypothetical protein [Tanacetum cinerariifolium]
MPVHIIVKDTRTMDMTIDQQVALDEALVPHASRLRIGKSNFRLRSDITSKKSTLQLVYNVLRLTPFYKAFLVTADVPEICMKELWATATVHHHSIWFKMDNRKRTVNLEYFRKMMHICPRLPGQTFDALPFEEEILAFLRFLGHSGEIRKLTDVAMTDAEQIQLAMKRSLSQTHISSASGSGADEGTGIIPRVPDLPTEESDEEIS